MSSGSRRVWCALAVVELLVSVLLLAFGLGSPVSAQTPTPVPVATAAPGVIAQPVVVVGYGQGARGVDLAVLAVLFCGFGAVILLLLFQFLGGKS